MSTEVVLSSDLDADIAAYQQKGFRLDVIFPADGPRVAELSDGDRTVRLKLAATEVAAASDAPVQLTRGGEFGEGRAGLQYRDLIPDRHGGLVIASHIRIAEPGPVPDYVHHHDIAFQIIFCRRGRVRVVYEDQGEPFWMNPGDCVLQPPHIRHRVLESADSLEVVEIASPAEHPTFVEHEITLPTNIVDPDRDYGGQRFSFDRASETPWQPAESVGWSQKATGIEAATNGAGGVRTLWASFPDSTLEVGSDTGVCVLYVLQGTAEIVLNGEAHVLHTDDSISIRGDAALLTSRSANTEVLQVVVSTESGEST